MTGSLCRRLPFYYTKCAEVCCIALQCVAVCCSVLQCAAVGCSVLQCLLPETSSLRRSLSLYYMECVAVGYNVLQWVTICCSGLQCVAVGSRALKLLLLNDRQYVGDFHVTTQSVLQWGAVRWSCHFQMTGSLRRRLPHYYTECVAVGCRASQCVTSRWQAVYAGNIHITCSCHL